MRRTVMMCMLCAALATPMVASAGDQTIPPEAQWTPTPPARATVDANRLAGMLVDTGVISPHEYTHLTQTQASSPAPHRRAGVWTWEAIDHNPVRSRGGD
jgi:hypothetical protein